MVNLYFAYTAAINPAGASPVLTSDQIWAGLQRKIRYAQEFVSAISSCDVISDEGESGAVIREVVFAGSDPSAPKLREVVRSYKPLKVDFHQPDGGLVSNIVSGGESGKPEDLYMTYTFQWLNRPGEEGSEEAEKALEKGKAMSKIAVEGSINTIRKMVEEGKIPA